MPRRGFACLVLTLALTLALGASLAPAASGHAEPEPGPAPADIAAARATIAAYQRLNQALQDVGWQLARGNAAFCERTVPAIGLQLQDAASYRQPGFVRTVLGLKGDFAVQTVARNSPAARSGAFSANREIARIDDTDPNGWAAAKRLDWERVERAHDWIELALDTRGSVTLGFADGTAATVSAVPVCATRFSLVGEQNLARANGTRVFLGTEFPAFAYEEPVFAGVVAHELAHNLLRHREWLARHTRKRRNVRLAEREADRLMPWLLANAGYDPGAAVTFMQRWGPRHDGGLVRARTHDGWDERAKFIAAELPQIAALMASAGTADWSRHFVRDATIASDPAMARRK